MATIRHDAQGFLVGELLDVSRKLAEGQDKGLDMLQRIERSVARLAKGSSPNRSQNVYLPAVEPRLTRAASNPRSASAMTGRVPSNVIVTPEPRRPKQAAIAPASRDASGRFVAGAARDVSNGNAGGAGGAGATSNSSASDGAIRQMAGNIKDMAANATNNIDPTINAAKEMKQIVEPLGRGWKYMTGRSTEQKKERWYKRILKALTPSKKGKDALGTTAPRSGEVRGLFDGAIGGAFMGLITKILPILGAVLVPILAVGGALLAGLGIGKLISDWMTSSGVSEKLFNAIDAMKKTWTDMVDGLSKRWGQVIEWFAEKFDLAKRAVNEVKENAQKAKSEFERGRADAAAGNKAPPAAQKKTTKPERVGRAVGAVQRGIDEGQAAAGSTLEKVLPKGFRHKAMFDGISGGASLAENGRYTDQEAQQIRDLKRSGARTGVFGKGEMPAGIRAKIEVQARASGLDPETMLKIAAMESGGNPNAVSATGAIGIYQHVGQTASGLGVTDRFNVDQNISGGMLLAKQNMLQLKKAGIPATAENLYMMHQLGPKAAKEVIKGAQNGLSKGQLSAPTQKAMNWNYGAKSATAKDYVSTNSEALTNRVKLVTDGQMASPATPRAVKVPSMTTLANASIPPSPQVQVDQALNTKPDKPLTVNISGTQVGQNVSDRGIAHVVTGGIGFS